MYNIGTLAQLAGISRRTVRYYVQRGLLQPPSGANRGAFYNDGHLERLNRIKQLSGQGVPLIHMKSILDGKDAEITPQEVIPSSPLETTTWNRLRISREISLDFIPGSLDRDQLSRIADFIKKLIGEVK